MAKTIVAPSLLAADFRFLDRELKLLQQNNIKFLHFDVMDGHFVPNLSFGLTLLEALAPHYDFVYDVHLMITNPQDYALRYIEKGANIVTFHLEVFEQKEDVLALIRQIKDAGAKVGISIKPKTCVKTLLPFLPLIDLVLVMSVEPGFGGQAFMEYSLKKLAFFRAQKAEHGYKYMIEVDGGINGETGKLAKEAGAEVLVAGSYLFGKEDIGARIKGLRE